MTSEYTTADTTSSVNDGIGGRLTRFGLLLFSSSLAFVVAELVEVNRFLRTVIHGKSFWAYTVILIFTFALLLALLPSKDNEGWSRRMAQLSLLGTVVGYVGSLLGILFSPILLKGELPSSLIIWRHFPHFFLAGLISLGWLNGAVAAFIYHSILSNNRRRLIILFAGCLVVRGVELALHIAVGERLW